MPTREVVVHSIIDEKFGTRNRTKMYSIARIERYKLPPSIIRAALILNRVYVSIVQIFDHFHLYKKKDSNSTRREKVEEEIDMGMGMGGRGEYENA